MSTEHVVVPTEPCPNRPDGTTLGPLVCVTKDGNECRGCLSDGRRALLDQAVPVERCWPDSAQMWVEVES